MKNFPTKLSVRAYEIPTHERAKVVIMQPRIVAICEIQNDTHLYKPDHFDLVRLKGGISSLYTAIASHDYG